MISYLISLVLLIFCVFSLTTVLDYFNNRESSFNLAMATTLINLARSFIFCTSCFMLYGFKDVGSLVLELIKNI